MKERGTELHEYAAEAIRLGRFQPRNKDTINMYINDAIGFKLKPEVPLFYAYECFGTADAIDFKKNILRIHDLKTGETEAHMDQLYIYAALFCLEYGRLVHELRKNGKTDIEIADELEVDVSELSFEPERFKDIVLRIYQFGEIKEVHPEPNDIREYMDLIQVDVDILKKLKAEG